MNASPFLMKNSKQTLVFNFNNVVSEHVHDDDDEESSEVLIGKNLTHSTLMLPLILFTLIN